MYMYNHTRVQRRIILPSKFFFIIVHDDIVAISSITTFNDSSCTGAGLGVLGSQTGGPQNLQQPPMCPSPSAHSDSSSGNGRLSSAGSEPGTLRSCSSSTCKWSSGIIVSVSWIYIYIYIYIYSRGSINFFNIADRHISHICSKYVSLIHIYIYLYIYTYIHIYMYTL